MISLDEARANIGRGVVYRPSHGPAEQGVITSVGEFFVFVRYAAIGNGVATCADDLEWFKPEPPQAHIIDLGEALRSLES